MSSEHTKCSLLIAALTQEGDICLQLVLFAPFAVQKFSVSSAKSESSACEHAEGRVWFQRKQYFMRAL